MPAELGARGLAVVLGLAFALASPNLLAILLLSAALLPVVMWRASGRRALAKRTRALLPLVFGLLLSFAVIAAVGGNSQVWLQRAYSVGARMLAATLLLCWLTHDLTIARMERALLALRLPAAFVALVMETRAFAAQISQTMHAAWAACALRGGLSSWRSLSRTIGSVAGVVVLRSIDRSERVAVASALRGAGAVCRHNEATLD